MQIPLSYVMGLKSVDYTIKTYAPIKRTKPKRLDHKVTKEINTFVRKVQVDFTRIGKTDDSAGHFMAGMSLLRVTSALEAALLLTYYGYVREVYSVLRSLLEQIAWCAAVRWEPRDEERLLLLSGEACIRNLKVLYPGVGKFYGLLSEIVHHHPRRHFFLDPPLGTGRKAAVYTQHPDYKLFSFVLLLVLCDVHGVVVESLYEDEMIKSSSWASTALGKIVLH